MLFKRDPLDRYEAAFQPLPGAPDPVSLTENLGCKWPVRETPYGCCGLHAPDGRYCADHTRKSGIRLEPLA